ncbi:MAG: lipopolysaccharide heptosyltransferase II [Candidatus Hydrogenedentes bacterium]|nr:lipopolysaccharide heptosyltransferase II [Candidatus Hydrogenedentota bacterium]
MKTKDSININSILMYAPNWFGDAVMSTPFIRCVKEKFPNSNLTVLAKGSVCELLSGLKYIDSYIPLQSSLLSQISAVLKVKKEKFDLAFILPHSLRSALITFLGGVRHRVGYSCNGRGLFLNHKVYFPKDAKGNRKVVYMTEEYLALGKDLGVEDDKLGPELSVVYDVEKEWLEELSREEHSFPRVGIAPGSAFGPSKRWKIEKFAEVGKWIYAQYETPPVLLTAPDEIELKRHFATICGNFVDPFAKDSSIERLKAVIKNLDILICNDSGTRHIAVAFGVPTLTIVGPTALDYSLGPYERGAILRARVDCAPCQLPKCPIDHRCMEVISTGMVIEKLKGLIENREKVKVKGVEICDIIYNQ